MSHPFENGFTRRQVLAGLGAGAGSIFLPSLAPAGTEAPRRLIFIYSMQGTVYPNWKMRFGGNPEDSDWEESLSGLDSSDFSEALRPLHPLRDKLTIVDGLAMISAMDDQVFDPHAVGQNHSLTGASIIPVASMTAVASAPSVDQIIADQVRTPGQWPSLQFTTLSQTEAGCIYGLNNEPLHLDNNPRAAYDRIFAQPVDTALYGVHAELISEKQPDVLEMVQRRYDALIPKMSAADQQKLQLHLDLVRDTQFRLENPILCEPGDPPDVGGWPGLSVGQHYEASWEAFKNLMATALSCDISRVGSIQLVSMPNELVGAPTGDVHDEYAHEVENFATAREVMTDYYRIHAEHFRDFCELLDGIPEGGGSVLDNSAVVWVCELGDGAHHFGPWPVVIAGGAAGGLKTGRYLYYAPTTPKAATWTWAGGGKTSGPPHNQLLVSLCHLMGVDRSSIGNLSARGDNGEDIDLTGPLPRLL